MPREVLSWGTGIGSWLRRRSAIPPPTARSPGRRRRTALPRVPDQYPDGSQLYARALITRRRAARAAGRAIGFANPTLYALRNTAAIRDIVAPTSPAIAVARQSDCYHGRPAVARCLITLGRDSSLREIATTAQISAASPRPAAPPRPSVSRRAVSRRARPARTEPRAVRRAAADQPMFYVHDGPKAIALTIDDGPSPVYTPQVLRLL